MKDTSPLYWKKTGSTQWVRRHNACLMVNYILIIDKWIAAWLLWNQEKMAMGQNLFNKMLYKCDTRLVGFFFLWVFLVKYVSGLLIKRFISVLLGWLDFCSLGVLFVKCALGYITFRTCAKSHWNYITVQWVQNSLLF